MTMAMEVQKLQAQLMNGRAGIETVLYSFILPLVSFFYSSFISFTCQSNEGGAYGNNTNAENDASGHQNGVGYYDEAYGHQVR